MWCSETNPDLKIIGLFSHFILFWVGEWRGGPGGEGGGEVAKGSLRAIPPSFLHKVNINYTVRNSFNFFNLKNRRGLELLHSDNYRVDVKPVPNLDWKSRDEGEGRAGGGGGRHFSLSLIRGKKEVEGIPYTSYMPPRHCFQVSCFLGVPLVKGLMLKAAGLKTCLFFIFRFASNKYSNDSSSVGDVFMHLTNYSINKNSSTYSQNDDSTSCQVHIEPYL